MISLNLLELINSIILENQIISSKINFYQIENFNLNLVLIEFNIELS